MDIKRIIQLLESSKMIHPKQITTSNNFLKDAVAVSIVASFICYCCFVLIKTLHLTENHINLSLVTPWMVEWIVPDGLREGKEGIILYALMFVNMSIALIAYRFLHVLKNHQFFEIAIGVVCCFYIWIGIHFPEHNIYPHFIRFSFIALGLSYLFLLLYQYYQKLFIIFMMMLLFPVCFIATTPIAIGNYNYIFFPALKLIQGVPLQKIYFQYDLFLSLLAAGWLKLNLDINLFQVVGQISYYFFFVGVFFFARKFFIQKFIPFFLIFFMVIIRWYANCAYPLAAFQVTPLRLDLWLILAVLVYYRGVYDWTIGVFVGLLIFFHRNFGMIYCAAYVQLLFVLYCIDVFTYHGTNLPCFLRIKNEGVKHLKMMLVNSIIIGLFLVVTWIVFKEFFNKTISDYQSFGVSFVPISLKSFYWIIPVIVSVTGVYLFSYRQLLDKKYFSTALFLLLISIGNSFYFFGRSNNGNLINVSEILLVVIFLCFDLVSFSFMKDGNKRGLKIISMYLPFVLLFGSMFASSAKTTERIMLQYHNFKNKIWIYPIPNKESIDFTTIRNMTHNTTKVYFMVDEDADFLHYYYGGYTPVGYVQPYRSYIIKKDFISFLQVLLDDQYFLVLSPTAVRENQTVIPALVFNNLIEKNGYTFISK